MEKDDGVRDATVKSDQGNQLESETLSRDTKEIKYKQQVRGQNT